MGPRPELSHRVQERSQEEGFRGGAAFFSPPYSSSPDEENVDPRYLSDLLDILDRLAGLDLDNGQEVVVGLLQVVDARDPWERGGSEG
jgi:hypothetical protein